MSSARSIRRAGDRAVLVELDGNDAVQRLVAGLEVRRDEALEEIVPGHETVLLVWREGTPPIEAIEQLISSADLTTEASAPAPTRPSTRAAHREVGT